MDPNTARKYLDRVKEVLPNLTWKVVERMDSATIFEGASPNLTLTVAEFDIAEQGFPPGSKGYDGMAAFRNEKLFLRLPRNLAEEAFRSIALEKTPDLE